MNRIMLIILLSNVFLFGLLIVLGRLLLNVKEKKKIQIRFHSSYSLKSWLLMIMASFALTMLLSQITFSHVTNVMLFLSFVTLFPAVISSEMKRREQEELFSEVILYCQNTAVLLKQNHNVYSTVQKISDDVNEPLRSDLKILTASLEEGKEQCEKVMRTLEKKYPYSCVQNLDVILLYMFFENSNIPTSLLETYQDDIEKLEQDVKDNRSKRKTLRMQYILITVGSLLSYWLMLHQIQLSFRENLESLAFKQFNALYIFTTLLCLFAVDRYFNSNITKE